ncbi:MAG: Gfo/Idh/MocA family oxidoreductase, partial [Planctomycetota bacterium]
SRLARRRFLKVAGAAVAAPFIVPRTAWGANEHVNAAVIGVGGRGSGLLSGLLADNDARVLAVCDVDRPRRESAGSTVRGRYGPASRCGTYNDFREVLERKDIDAVAIGAPDHLHALMAISAMQAGKDVYCEKPVSLTISEGRRIVETAKRYSRVLQAGTQRRSDPAFRRMCELVRNGRIGQVQRVETGVGTAPGAPMPWRPEPIPEGFDYDLWLGPAPWAPYCAARCHFNFRYSRDYSGGALTDNGAHCLDITQWGLGAEDSGPVEIEGQGKFFDTGLYNTFYEFHVEYKYAGGTTVVCTNGPYGQKFIGTEGWISSDREGQPLSMLKSVIRSNEVHLHEAHGDHLRDFIWSVQTRGRTAATAEIGHRSATVCQLGAIALALGRKLRWDPAKEEFSGDELANKMRSRPYRAPWRL